MSLYLGTQLLAGVATNTISNAHDLFDFKWTDHELTDQSWLRADTFSWQDGTVYSEAYNHLVADYNGGTSQTETVGSYTITYVLATDGHKITTDETNVANIYNESGVAWYYILDTANQRFKLPRTKYGFIGLRDTVGKYVSESLPNINGYFAYDVWQSASYDGGAFYNDGGNKRAGAGNDNNSSGSITRFDASRSSSTYQDNAPVQQRATQMYLYFYVGQFSQSATEQTAGLNSELFNGKADVDLNNLNSTGKAKLGPTVYTVSGFLVNQGSGDLAGYGTATVYLYKNGIAEVHFNVKITTTGTGSTSFACGINRDLLKNLNANIPTITPVIGGSLTYCSTSGTIADDRMGYGGTLSAVGQFWEPARVYTTSGDVGGWPASNLVANQRLIGVCYGTYTV